jgi:hypothetical protein
MKRIKNAVAWARVAVEFLRLLFATYFIGKPKVNKLK